MAILTLSLMAIAATNYISSRNTTLRMVEGQAQQIADAHAQRLAQWLQSKQSVVSSLAPHVDADERIGVLRTAVKAAGFDQAYMGYPDGTYLFSENRSTRAADYDPRTRSWYQGALATGGKNISEPYIGASTGKLIITFSELVGSPFDPQAVVAGDVIAGHRSGLRHRHPSHRPQLCLYGQRQRCLGGPPRQQAAAPAHQHAACRLATEQPGRQSGTHLTSA